MKSHLRGKMLQMQFRKEDAIADPIGFAQKLEASSMSQAEKKTYDICKLRIFDVYPRIRYDVKIARRRFSQANINGKVYRFPLRKLDGKLAERSHQRKPISKNSESLSVTDAGDDCQRAKSTNDASSPTNSISCDEDSLAARRTKRENAGKRGGVQSKYIFKDGRIFGERFTLSTLPVKRKTSSLSSRTTANNESISSAKSDERSIDEASSW